MFLRKIRNIPSAYKICIYIQCLSFTKNFCLNLKNFFRDKTSKKKEQKVSIVFILIQFLARSREKRKNPFTVNELSLLSDIDKDFTLIYDCKNSQSVKSTCM